MPQRLDTFELDAIAAIKRDHEHLRNQVQDLQRRLALAERGSAAQPIIGRATGVAGAITGTFRIQIQHGPYRNAAGDADGEYAAPYTVDAKPWITPSLPTSLPANTRVLLWRAPFGAWYFVADSKAYLILFELTGDLTTTAGFASASVVSYDLGSDPGASTTVFNSVRDPALVGALDLRAFEGKTGDRGLAYLSQNGIAPGNYYILTMFHPQERKAVADGNISAGGSGTVSVWREGSDSGYDVTAYLNWMHGGTDVTAGTELIIRWFPDEEKWIIVAAEC